jgi:hypothetical protein
MKRVVEYRMARRLQQDVMNLSRNDKSPQVREPSSWRCRRRLHLDEVGGKPTRQETRLIIEGHGLEKLMAMVMLLTQFQFITEE